MLPAVLRLLPALLLTSLILGCGFLRQPTRPPAPAKEQREGDLEERTRTVNIPGRTETRTRYVTKSVPVTKYEYRCRTVMQSVTRYETRYEYQYDYVTKSNRMVSRSVPVTRYESRQDCRNETRIAYESRTEAKYETVWIPPTQRTERYWHKVPELLEAEPEVHARPTR